MNIFKQWKVPILIALFTLFSLASANSWACNAPSESFCVDYFANENLSGAPVLTAVETAIDHSWQGNSPAPAVPVYTFSGHWQGNFALAAGSFIFHTLADDGVRLKIDGQVVIDNWRPQGPTDKYATVPITAGVHTIEVEYFQEWDGARLKVDWKPAPTCNLPVGQFCVAYYNNNNLSGSPAVVANETTIDHTWQGNSPDPLIPTYNFSGHWQGSFVLTAGNYIFHTLSDDGVRLKIDGQIVINDWLPQGPTDYSATVPITAGAHTIEVDYYQEWGGARLKVDWKPIQTCDLPVGQFCVAYYSTVDLSGAPALVAKESAIDHTWQNNSPDPAVPVYNFSGHWQGNFVLTTGSYIFHTLSDDGVRLKIDGQVVIDDWLPQGPTDTYSTIPITAGTHKIEVDYYQAWGGGRLKVDWKAAPCMEQFCVAYYDNTTLSGAPVFVTGESVVDHTWQGNSPDATVPVNNFSGHWQGSFALTGGNYIFHTLSDDGVRLKIDGQLVIDDWLPQGPTDFYATVPVTAGVHNIEVEYYQAYGGARLKVDWNPVLTCDLPVGQFCVTYFNNANLTGNPSLINHESTIAHNWSGSSPAPNIASTLFSGRWQGQFDFVPGTYAFNTLSDDGVRLWVDGQLVIDDWLNQGSTAYNKSLWLGGRHQIKVEYFQGYGNAILNVGWQLIAPATTASTAMIKSNNLLGTNLSDWMDWSTEQPFINLFKTSRGWITQAPGVWDTAEQANLDLDANGWVRSLPAATDPTLRYRSVSTILVDGADLADLRRADEFIVLYDGEGLINYGLAASKNVAASSPGRDVLNVDANNAGGIMITISATDPNKTGNYIRNLRVVSSGSVCTDDLLAFCVADNDPACQRAACSTMESAVDSRLFHPIFLRTLAPYRTLRFMQPMSTNVLGGNYPQIVNWSDRSTPDSARWANQKGIPIEVATALANQIQSDPWVNMPHQASDDYIRQSARLAHSTLAPARKIYVEYANEIWNTAFSAGSWVEAQGQAAWPTAPDSAYTKRTNWYGKRTAQMCDIWRSEWPGEENRVICVLSGQAANTWTTSAALDCNLWDQAPCQAHGIKAIAIAPYFADYLGGSATAAEVTGWASDADGGLSRLFAELEFGGQLSTGPSGGALVLANQRVTQYVDLANSRSLDLVAYEGGQSLAVAGDVVNSQPMTNLFIAANRDPRMGYMYSKYLDNWHAAGGKLFLNFMSTGNGSWGVLEKMTQANTPRLNALINYINKNSTP